MRRQLGINKDKGCLGNLKWMEPRKKAIIGGWFSCSIFDSESCNAPLRPPCFCPCFFNIDGDSKKHSSMTHIILLGVNSIQPQRTMCKPPKILDSAQLSSGCMFSGVFSMLYYPHLLFFIFSCDYIYIYTYS